jgi:cell division FtsZ-interacting protein ZapD
MDKKLPEKLCFNNAYLSLPSEWDASISQLEMMQKIAYNINQIIQFLTDLETNYQNYTDAKVAELKAELLKTLDKTEETLRAYIDTQDVYYWTEHTKDVKRLETLIADLRAYIDDVKLTHEKDVAQLNGKIDEIVNKYISAE